MQKSENGLQCIVTGAAQKGMYFPSLYASIMIEREQLNGNSWPSLIAAILCWILFAVVYNNNKRKNRGFICSLSLAVCFISALAASGIASFLTVRLFIGAVYS